MTIEVFSAGAGSGKTFTLTGKMTELLQSGVRAKGIVATTFTQKSATELQERVRVRLLEAGQTEAANDLSSALIGTVHSIGVRLLQRFAFEAGVSPLVEIIASGDEQRLFNESLAQVLTEARIEAMNLLTDRLGLTKNPRNEFDWRSLIRHMTDVARANNFSAEVLQKSKTASWETFEKMLPPVQDIDDVTWHNRLLSAIDQTVAALENNEADATKVTRDATETLRNLQNQLKWRGELYWYEWVKIAKTSVATKSKDLFEPLKTLALQHDEHRRFRADIQAFQGYVFDISIDALSEYEHYKQKRGLIDYIDMETYVSKLLRMDTVRETLRSEIDLLLVDEFQDTSPIQLDIFLQLSQLAKHSIWVGDPKQSIYGFRGAEPALMQAIIEATGGVKSDNILKQSWRSRADLVHAVNAIFTRAFSQMPPEQVVLQPVSTLEKEKAAHGAAPPLALIHWHFKSDLDERRTPASPWLENCIAANIHTFLEKQYPVFNKKRSATRPVRPGDIAVLCRSNDECIKMAEALHRVGLKAAIARHGLLQTPEASLVTASLKYILTPSDHLSATELLLMSGSATLETIVEARLQWIAAKTAAPGEVLPYSAHSDYRLTQHDSPILQTLNALRPRVADLGAAEIVNLLIDELDLRRLAVKLGNPNQRLDNLDQLRHYATEYESACQRLHTAASLSGFLLWLSALADNENDKQGSGEGDDTVQVVTYHRSKGLEYPVTVCHSLDQGLREQVWGLNLIPETDKPDLNNILGNRWLRYWVNPYADQQQGTRLNETLRASEAWAIATRQAIDEEARLLYVGLTRARDYLILPTTMKGTRWLNRVFNQGNEDTPTLDPHAQDTPFYWQGEALQAETNIFYMPKDQPEADVVQTPVPFHPDRAGKHATGFPPLYINADAENPPYTPVFDRPKPFAGWLSFKGECTEALQQAVRAFCMADDARLPHEHRLSVATRQLQIRQTADAVIPLALLRQSDALQQWLQNQWPEAVRHVHYPLAIAVGKRKLYLEADLWLETANAIGIIHFAPFAEGMKRWEKLLGGMSTRLGWLQHAAVTLHPGKSVRVVVVFPIDGQVVEG